MAPRKALMQAVGADMEVLKTIADAGKDRVLFSYGSGPDYASALQRREVLRQLCAGRDMTAITQVRGSGLIFGLSATLPGRGAAWMRLRQLGFTARLAATNDPQTAAALVEDAKREGFREILGHGVDKIFYMGAGTTPDYGAGDEQNLLQLAAARNEHWSETFLRMSRETAGKELFTLRMFNPDLKALAHLLKSENCFPSLGDAGAHVSQIMDAGWASFVLSYWVREKGLYTQGRGDPPHDFRSGACDRCRGSRRARQGHASRCQRLRCR